MVKEPTETCVPLVSFEWPSAADARGGVALRQAEDGIATHEEHRITSNPSASPAKIFMVDQSVKKTDRRFRPVWNTGAEFVYKGLRPMGSVG